MSVPPRKNVRLCNPSISPPLVPFPCDPPPRASNPSSPLATSIDAPSIVSPAAFSSDGVGVGVGRQTKKEKRRQATPCKCHVKLEETLLCVDFLPAFNALAIGNTRAVSIFEVVEQVTSQPQPSVSMVLRDCGTFGNLARVETLAWYPAADEATLAIVQLSRSVTVFFDCLALKGGRRGYMAQQGIRNAPGRSVVSATSVGSGLLSSAVLSGGLSVPSTPATVQQKQGDSFATAGVPTARRTAPGPSCGMVEAVIDTDCARVERIAWDPHNPYTLALTSDATHFELWSIPVTATVVYPPRLVLRPPAHNGQAITRGVAFSPSDPNLIIVVVDVANAGQVIVYDRRQVEVPRHVDTPGHCLTLVFHPTYCDLLAVCYRKKKTQPDSRVQFFRVLDEVNSPQRDGGPSVVEQQCIPPIDSFAPLHRIRWRPPISRPGESLPCTETDRSGATMAATSIQSNSNGDGSVTNSNNIGGIIDAISSQLWFASVAQTNVQDVSVWDAANGFCPIISIRGPFDKCEAKDCVWVNPLSLVTVFKSGEVVLTTFLDDTGEGRDTLFRFPSGGSETRNSDVFSLSAILPSAAVVSDYFGRRFVVRNTSSQIREYYKRVVRTEACELVEQLLVKAKLGSSAVSSVTNYCNTATAAMSRECLPGGLTESWSSRLSPQPQSLHCTHSPYPVQNALPSTASSRAVVSLVGGNQTPGTSKTPKEKKSKIFGKIFSFSSDKTQMTNVAKEQQRKNISSKPQRVAPVEAGTSPVGVMAGTISTPLSNSDVLAPDVSQITAVTSFSRGSNDANLELIFPTLLTLAGKDVGTPGTVPEVSKGGIAKSKPLIIPITSPIPANAVHALNSVDERQWQLFSPRSRTPAYAQGMQQMIVFSSPEGRVAESSNSSNRNIVPQFESFQTILRSPTSIPPSEEDNAQRRSANLILIPRKGNPSCVSKANISKEIAWGNNYLLSGLSLESGVLNSSAATTLPFLAAAASVVSPVSLSSSYAPQRWMKGNEEHRAAKACDVEMESMNGLLGLRSRVSPVIERFVLDNETCGWAYVERGAEAEAFVRYAREWQVGYETARQMHNARRVDYNPTDDEDAGDHFHFHDGTARHGTRVEDGNRAQTGSAAISVMEAHHVDRRFARIMEHNASVCEACERELLEEDSQSHRLDNAVSLSISHDTNNNTGNIGNATVDPRAHLWAALAHALRSHDVSLVTTLVTAQLDYAALLGDAQYCIVLYLLYGLWWRQRHCCVWCHPCPLVPNGSDDHKHANENKGHAKKPCHSHPQGIYQHGTQGNANADGDCGRKSAAAVSLDAVQRRWWLRALQWLEQYVTWLHACGLHVALNELLLIVPRVTGESFNPVHPRAADIAYKKQLTYVHCGMCRNAALVPCALTQATPETASKSKNSAPLKLRASEWVHGDTWESDDNDYDDDDDDSCRTFTDSFSSTTSMTPVESTLSTLPHNASCRLCHSRAHMVCVICEEIVEGMYFFLRGCGHGGHVHHIEEWLRLSNECPRCGEKIVS